MAMIAAKPSGNVRFCAFYTMYLLTKCFPAVASGVCPFKSSSSILQAPIGSGFFAATGQCAGATGEAGVHVALSSIIRVGTASVYTLLMLLLAILWCFNTTGSGPAGLYRGGCSWIEHEFVALPDHDLPARAGQVAVHAVVIAGHAWVAAWRDVDGAHNRAVWADALV